MSDNIQTVYPRLGGSDQQAFERALQTGEPHVAYCPDCNYTFYYPRLVCPRCLRDNVELVVRKEPLEVFSFTYVHRVQSPIFTEQSPALMLTIVDGDLRMIVEGHGWSPESPPVIGSLVMIDCQQRSDKSMVIFAKRVKQGE